MIRFPGYLTLCVLIGLLAACATKPTAPEETAATGAAKPTPTPSASAPKPSPTPGMTYAATARVIGADGREVSAATPNPTATPTPAPTATPSPSPAASPSPAPAAANGNFLTRTWAKIFPPKTKTAVNPASPDRPAPGASASPSPTPAAATPSKEGIFARAWHLVFPRKKVPPAAAPPAWIGSIRLVNASENYVLVDAPNYPSFPTGETLHSVGDRSENAILRISADRNPPFFIADIVSGRPRVGDRVYSPEPTH